MRRLKVSGGYWQDLLHLHSPLASRFTFLIFMAVSFRGRGEVMKSV